MNAMQELSDQLAEGARRLRTPTPTQALRNALLGLADELPHSGDVLTVTRRFAEFGALLSPAQRLTLAGLVEDVRDALTR